ncbi:MAG: sulfite exporter TauE/SafE family protein [Rubripirellula sp.]|nr:sulfite exporter TauE/SafE family protein [Rubripirellula sp.]
MTAGDFGWYLLLIGAGFTAGIVNSIAGGGSFLTLPALMLFGLDPKLANGTNRLAVLFSSASAVATFQKHGHLDQRMVLRVGVPTLLGVPLGSLLAVHLSADAFRGVFGFLFLIMAGIILLDPKRLTGQKSDTEISPWKLSPVFVVIGIYVGFMQAGMGILLLVAMSWLQSGDLTASNAVKNSVGFLVTFAATVLFVAYGLVAWVPGLVMAFGNVIGGVVGARLAIKKGNRLVVTTLLLVMIGTGLKMLFDALF